MTNTTGQIHDLPVREKTPAACAPCGIRRLILPLLAICALLPALAGARTYWTGQSVANVEVTLQGPGERLIVQEGAPNPATYTYTATGTYDVTGQKEEEAVEKTIVETYNWSVGRAVIVSGGGSGDATVTVRYNTGDEASNTISVTFTATPGGSDSASIEVVVPTWQAGETIQCTGGITAPADGSAFAVGEEVPLTLDTVADADRRVGAETTTAADTCTVTWTASAGTFKDDLNTGNSVTWIAPADDQDSVTITATVCDQATIPLGEKGARDDDDYTDSINVLVYDISLTMPSVVSVNQSGIAVQAALMAGSTPIPGKYITFSSSDLTFVESEATTDSSGIATVSATASGSPSSALDASSVTAVCESISDTAYFTIVEASGASADSDSILVGAYADNTLYSSLLTFTVTPAIAGVPLTFALQSGTGVGYSIPASLEDPSACTDANGTGTVRLRSSDLRECATVNCTFHGTSAAKTITFTGITSVE